MLDYMFIFYERYEDITEALFRHLIITMIAIILACVFAIPIGIYLAKTSQKWIQSTVFTITNIFQTIPSLAMLAIFIPIIGIGFKPAIVALFLYSLLPILRNTYAAFKSIDDSIMESAIGMGYAPMQRLFRIEIIINWATLAALIGAGGFGQLIIGGMGVNNKPLILAAAILAMVLALVTDFLLAKTERLFSKKMNVERSDIMEERA